MLPLYANSGRATNVTRSGSQSIEVIYLLSAQDGLYGKEPFSVYLRFGCDSGSFSDLRDQALRGYTEKI